jgi:hypothetical protein
MEMIIKTQQLSVSTKFAIGSFITGTFFFLFNLLLPNDTIFLLGFVFVLFAIFFNLIILGQLIYQLVINPSERQANFIRILIVLSNIPIAYFYLIITVNL